MKTIPLHILDHTTGKKFKCNIIEGYLGWQCVLYQDYFRFQFIKESTLDECILILAKYLEPLDNITIHGEIEADSVYINILNAHYRSFAKEKHEHFYEFCKMSITEIRIYPIVLWDDNYKYPIMSLLFT